MSDFFILGDSSRARTCDMLIKSQLLCQLSYGAKLFIFQIEPTNFSNAALNYTDIPNDRKPKKVTNYGIHPLFESDSASKLFAK